MKKALISPLFFPSLFLLAATTSPVLLAADPAGEVPAPSAILSTEQPATPELPSSWKWSLAPLVASQALDIASSYGMRELNPLLAGSQGQFGAKATLIKVGVTAALVGAEYLIAKAHPRAAKIFTGINWSVVALTTGFAAHNVSVH